MGLFGRFLILLLVTIHKTTPNHTSGQTLTLTAPLRGFKHEVVWAVTHKLISDAIKQTPNRPLRVRRLFEASVRGCLTAVPDSQELCLTKKVPFYASISGNCSFFESLFTVPPKSYLRPDAYAYGASSRL